MLSIESSEEAKFINSILEMVEDTYETVWMGLYRNLKGNSNQNLNWTVFYDLSIETRYTPS